jgi:hypothetical protein
MKMRVIRTVLASVTCVLMGASIASAQASRTWVSGVGDDANPCSRTAPCKTFAGAISKTATGGEIDALDPAGYGALTITKSITINGVGTEASILVSGTNGVNVSAPAGSLVTLRNLQINGIGTGLVGVRFSSGSNLILDNVNIFGFDTAIESDVVANTHVTGGYLSNNRSFAVNARAGNINLEHTQITNNNVGVQASTLSGNAGTVRLSDTAIYSNATSMGCGGGTLASAGNNRVAGNNGGIVATCTPTVVIAIQ